MKKVTLAIMLVSAWTCTQGQTVTKEKLEVLENSYQSCLDSGVHMLQCSEEFYKQMDYSLNVVYKSLYSKLSSERKAQLKAAQLKWLKARDKEFLEIDKEEKANGLAGEDYKMSVLNRRAEYVKDRVIELLTLNEKK